MSTIIGRSKEVDELKQLVQSGRAEFVAIYGRRRVGKTFLVDEVLREDITFRHAGLSPVDENGKKNNLKEQLLHFYHSLLLQGWKGRSRPKNWLEAFFMLEQHLQSIDTGERQVVFIDELPWLDTPRSGFITALEAFWNGWACHRHNMMLVVCGSANSWMLDNLVNNRGGLYGRTTYEIKLTPFSLTECEQFYESRGIQLSRYDIAQTNMILGGIPYYMSYFEKGKSLAQNIDHLFFALNAKLKDEFVKLFSSVFTNPDEMMRIVRFLATKRKGYTRENIAKGTQLSCNGDLSKWLKALAASDFIVSYVPFGESVRNVHFRLIDPFCLFYLKFVDGQIEMDDAFWMNNVDSPKINNWRGFAFEDLCLRHVDAIKRALQIAGISSSQSAWTVSGDDEQEGTQIDLLISRKDNVVNMCEMKFYSEEFAVTAGYHKKLVHRTNILQPHLSRKTVIHSTLVTTFGLTYNQYSGDFTNVVTLADMF
ncbi:MAG: ATP-binding protein [Paludibacteraceae bacterium]|nr:ATP-binding protein [Paludibacteraceae bacterium]